ncbi:MAG: glycosyltransferase family 4 protein [Methanoregulaceae archaeon]|nr:glycosyltransferase family 4 protein [Methanoregulaceae archaeon]
MNIGIISSVLNKSHTGIGNYTYHLIDCLNRMYEPKEGVVLVNDRHTDGFTNREVILSNPLPFFRSYGWYPYMIRKIGKEKGIDLLHNPYQVPTYFRPALPYIITVHDLTPWLFPVEHPAGVPAFFRLLMPRTLRYADGIIADSRSTKADLVRILGVPEEKIRVIHLGVDTHFRPVDDPGVRERYGLEGPFILTVGTLEPRKNLVGLLRAFRILRDGGIGHRLVVTGGLGWRYKEIFSTIRELHLEKDVILTGYIPGSDLPGVYSAAEVMVYPSLYEGFGFPPLEAMACGCPVVTSNVSSLPEIAGDVAVMVDPRDAGAIAAEIRRLLDDESIRRYISRKGIERAAGFTWEKCVKETMGVYREVGEARRV